MGRGWGLLVGLLGVVWLLRSGHGEEQRQETAAQRCFCQVSGYLDDCTCDVETIDKFNNYRLFPRLQKLLESDYFRYYKVNLRKPCPFWNDINQCGRRDCAVKPCHSDEVPDGIKSASYKYSEEANLIEECEQAERLGAVDASLSEETQKAVLQWTKHDDSSDSFCEVDGMTFVKAHITFQMISWEYNQQPVNQPPFFPVGLPASRPASLLSLLCIKH